jgi:Integrase core domain
MPTPRRRRPKPYQRRALTLLAGCGDAGCTEAVMRAHGFTAERLARPDRWIVSGSPRSPWQNPYVERLIGTLRRDCLDHIVIFGEQHLRRVLTSYSLYYNEARTHLGLGKDTPLRRAIQRSGTIIVTPILSGSHHRYARI